MDLKDLRNEIDKIDDELVELYLKRVALVKNVGEFKKANNIEVEHSDRELQILDRLVGKFGVENKTAIDYLFNSIMTYSKMEQVIINCDREDDFGNLEIDENLFSSKAVGVAGTTGAYAAKAANELFGKISPKFFVHFRDVFAAVKNGDVDYGVVPIENSTAGSVNEVYDLLKEYNLKISAAKRLTINHCLLGTMDSELQQIKKVFSHPQGLYQCRKFLNDLAIEAVEDTNTAIAAERVAKLNDKTIAAIGAEDNAKKNGLKVLSADIQDSKNNFTRFIVISKKLSVTPCANKVSLMVSIKHRSGTLYQLLSILSSFKVNLLKLESRPMLEHEFEFMFYLDIECDAFSPDTHAMLRCIDAYCQSMTILGLYEEKK